MKRRVLFLLGLLCLYFLGSVEAIAQDNTKTPVLQEANSNGKISGTLIDSLTARPVEYATVALLPKGSSQAREVTLTDATGKFQFLNVSVGEYEIVFSFIGFNNKTIPIIAVTENRREITLGNIKLTPSATALKEVTVEALRPTIVMEADRMVVSIAGTALAAGNTAYDVLAKAPGVFVDQDGNIQLNGRSGVTVMLDGKLTYLSSRDLRTLLEGMSAENIKNIEIITNPSAKYDAEGTSGILNINLRKNDVRGFNGSVYSGYTYNGKQHGYTSGGSVNYKAGNWNSFLNLDFARRVGGA